MSADVDPAADDGDPWRRRRLTGDGKERLVDRQRRKAEIDDPGDFEDDDPRTSLFKSCFERSRPVGGKARDPDDRAAAAARGWCRPADRARKGWLSRQGRREKRQQQ